MNNNFKNIKDAQFCKSIDKLLSDGNIFLEKNLADLDISSYCYQISEAVNELSLEEEIINELIEDYIIQILKSTIIFYKHIEELKKNKKVPPMEELEVLNVHALRRIARSFDNFPIKGREISKANRTTILDYFKSIK